MKIYNIQCGYVNPVVSGKLLSKKRNRYPVYCHLIECKKGLILVNTGLPLEGMPKDLDKYLQPEIRKGEDIVSQLNKLGYKPSDLDLVIITHLDADAAGGLKTVQDAKKIIIGDLEEYWSCRKQFKMYQPQCFWYYTKYEKYFHKGTTLGPQNHSIDLFEDESVQLVMTPGHTFDTTAVLLQNNGKKVLLSSDIVTSVETGNSIRTYHEEYQRRSYEWVKEVAADKDCLAIFPMHPEEKLPEVFEF